MSTPVWILKETVLGIHDEILARHGGIAGLKAGGLLDAALSRPKNLYAYSNRKANYAKLTAAYAYGVCNNHPFLDGNKRTAFVTSMLFLRLSGYTLIAPKADKVDMFLKLAAGIVSEQDLGEWIQFHAK